MGGGVVACEAATWLAALGADVTVVGRSDRLLDRQEPFVGALLGERFAATGVTVHLSTTVAGVQRAEVNAAGTGRLHGGPLTVTLTSGQTLRVDELVVAVGRQANSDGLGLEEVGLPGAGGFVDVDDQFEVRGVAGHWLYAVGDVCGRSLLTHMGKYQARITGEVIAARAQGERGGCPDYAHRALSESTTGTPQVPRANPGPNRSDLAPFLRRPGAADL